MEKLNSFAELSLDDQIQELYQQGLFIMSIRYYGYKINLYLFRGFFLEVFFNHKLDKIENIDMLDHSHTRMKFYLDQIKLDIH